MNAHKILFPTDLSNASQTALTYATALARDSGATLLILHVEEMLPPMIGDGVYLPQSTVPNPELKRQLTKVVPADSTVPCEHLLVIGAPAETILLVAEEHDVDLIVMGTHGRTGFGRMLMGSVAEAVVRRANCPVMTVKAEEKRSSKSVSKSAKVHA